MGKPAEKVLEEMKLRLSNLKRNRDGLVNNLNKISFQVGSFEEIACGDPFYADAYREDWDVLYGTLVGFEYTAGAFYFGGEWEPLDDMPFNKKKECASNLNWYARERGLAVAHPATEEPCLLVAVASRDKAGRFALQSMASGKRSCSTAELSDLLPFTFVQAPTRKENLSKGQPED